MPRLFFFSYARANGNDNYLNQFFEDLSQRIRDQLGLDKDEAVGFFDQPEIKLGADWEAELNDALQTCPVMVSLYSPAYFNSIYCGKEWEVFRQRQELYVNNARAKGEGVNRPPVIKPVIWIPLLEDQAAPPAIGRLQYYMGDPDADYNKVGVLRMRKLFSKHGENYENFIENLKNEILDAQDLKLPPLPDFTGLDKVESAFHPSVPDGTPPAPPPPLASTTGKGPQFVRFLFIAGKPDEFDAARSREFYLTHGGGDWKPYHPDFPSTIEWLAQKTAIDAGLRISDQLRFGPNLVTDVRNAESDGTLVVLFVDCWTAELPAYGSILRELDEYTYFNCSILIPWNAKDEQSVARRETLLAVVRDNIFRRWSMFAKAGIFYDSIQSVNELEDQLKDALKRLQTQVSKGIMDRATKDTIPRRIDTEIARPIMTHKPTEGARS